ncbi:hypothetical protein AVEN_187018-1 [Araneus ventricosus]|uniref:Uncharacterized protein n=1 Tax=Araneus ventricosus TaxID=182803 RepID=A0A4Y2CMV3_ARAVE|nr:hypothetical protein AVEN_187018-1 [Araneus ventricosus]
MENLISTVPTCSTEQATVLPFQSLEESFENIWTSNIASDQLACPILNLCSKVENITWHQPSLLLQLAAGYYSNNTGRVEISRMINAPQ